MNEIWILGATGRSGRAIAQRLAAAGVTPVLVGRDEERLRETARQLAARADGGPDEGASGGAGGSRGGGEGGTGPARLPRTVVAGSVEAVAARVADGAPAVVVNTVGPFTRTAAPVLDACPPGTHYLDLANELPAVTGVLDRHERAVAAGSCLVTGAGYGVLGTESVLLKLCQGRPRPHRVRVDAVPALVDEGGAVGAALAGSLVDGLAAGGRRYADGRLVRAAVGGDVESFTLPDGVAVRTGRVPSGELEAARRASGAPNVVSGSSEIPTSRVLRAVIPVAARLLAVPALGNAAKRRLAAVTVKPGPMRRESTWARARVEDADGTVREGWMRAADAMSFTSGAAAEVAVRLARGEGRPGAYTPGALFGPELAEAAGGRFILD
jgi:short subunit dehydrogenase-like uncharacterized protein